MTLLVRTLRALAGVSAVASTAFALAGCGDTKLTYPVGLSQPTAVAVFRGVTSKRAGVEPYVAIANGARDDLVLVDARDDEPVLSQVVVRALAIPTAPRPAMLVAGSLGDGGADLLGVVPGGTAALQVVRTWTADNQVVDELGLDLSAFAPGAVILSAIAVPVPGAGAGEVEPGKVRVVFGLSGGRLAVADYARDPADGLGLVASGVTLQDVGFDAVSLAVAPADARLIYAATPDDVPSGSGAHGVVELQAGGTAGAWTFELLPTRAPTRLVTALQVAERVWALNDDEIPESEPFLLKVYASLDPAGCGRERPIECGIVTVDPSPGVRGIAPDPLGEMPYQPPIPLPSEVLAMAAAIPPAVPPEGFQQGRLQIYTGLGVRESTAMIAAATADGRVYSVDPARRTIHNNQTMLRDLETGQTRTRVDAFEFTARTQPEPPTTQFLNVIACVRTKEPVVCDIAARSSDSMDFVEVTPGYTYSETFTLTYQGTLAGLSGRNADLADDGAGLRLAMQVPTATGFADVVGLYDPGLGVHVGDTVEVAVHDGAEACDVPDDPDTKSIAEDELDLHEFTITDILPPDGSRFPGGAVLLSGSGACYDALRAGVDGATASVRAAGFVLQGSAIGYAGRPVALEPAAENDLRFRAELRYVNEDAPEQACPLSPWPAHPEAVACDADCRARCERLSLARKARRWYTMPDACNGDLGCQQRWGERTYEPDPDGNPATNDARVIFSDPFPNKLGPVIAFTFTVRNLNEDLELVPTSVINRESGLRIEVEGGHSPAYRVPYSSGAAVLPVGLAPFDESPWDRNQSYRFFVAYSGDLVMDYSPSETINQTVSIQ